MKKVLLLTVLLSLSACVQSNVQRRNEYIVSNPNLSQPHQDAILNGKIMVGMSKEDVIASWGQPCWWCYGSTESTSGDTWEYNLFGSGRYGVGNGTYVFFNNNDKVTGVSK